MIIADGETFTLERPAPSFTMRRPSTQFVMVPVAGPEGPAGAPPLTYTLTGVSSWYQAHAFGYPPEVQVITGNELVRVTVTYPDPSHVSISFPNPFTGTVVLR